MTAISFSGAKANRFYKVIKKGKKYPLSIRNDLIKIEHKPSTVPEYWVRIPVKSVKGGLWIGLIKPYEPIPTDAKICESKLYKKDKCSEDNADRNAAFNIGHRGLGITVSISR